MLQTLDFSVLTWKQFEGLMADLLEAEEFVNVVQAGGSGGDMGLDISADEMRRSLSGRVSPFRWMIQCKHYAGQPGKTPSKQAHNVGHKEIGDILSFLDEHNAQGLLLITDTDVTASAAKKLVSFHESKAHPFEAHFWNARTLENRLRKHPDIIERYFGRPDKVHAKGKGASNPFKYLESFTAGDRHFFFGRSSEINSLVGLVHNSPVALLFGASGTGKTSLLNAGLLPALADKHFLVGHVRCLDDPATNIRREALRILEPLAKKKELAEIGGVGNLPEFLRRIRMFLDAVEGRAAIAVDQFEEAFTRAGVREQKELAGAVRAICEPNTSKGSLTLIFSIREDYIGSFWEWSHAHVLTDAWVNAFRIDRLGREEARAAIVRPLTRTQWTFQAGLDTQLISDLEKIGDGKIYPPYVQVVCGYLIDETGKKKTVSQATYASAGKAVYVVSDNGNPWALN